MTAGKRMMATEVIVLVIVESCGKCARQIEESISILNFFPPNLQHKDTTCGEMYARRRTVDNMLKI
jgi:hypothetical protein